MTNRVQVYHHLGLGDHIICNGLVRELCKTYDNVYCFAKKHNIESVSFMYRDEPRIELITVEDDWEVPLKFKKNIDVIKIGFGNLVRSKRGYFDESFYRQVGLDFNLRWDNFYVQRDYEIECQLLQKLNPDSSPYVLVHDDPSRGLLADLSIVRNDLKIIRVSDYVGKGSGTQNFRGYTLFHWISVLQNAEEIHCMDSSFKCLVESVSEFKDSKLFFHRYVRGKGPHQVCSTRKNWTIIKRPSFLFMAQSSIDRLQRKITTKLSPLLRPASPQITGK
jgi:hypothetical protein